MASLFVSFFSDFLPLIHKPSLYSVLWSNKYNVTFWSEKWTCWRDTRNRDGHRFGVWSVAWTKRPIHCFPQTEGSCLGRAFGCPPKLNFPGHFATTKPRLAHWTRNGKTKPLEDDLSLQAAMRTFPHTLTPCLGGCVVNGYRPPPPVRGKNWAYVSPKALNNSFPGSPWASSSILK